MFTGIITDVAEVLDINHGKNNTKLVLKTSFDVKKILIGASIACNGCCLTVTKKSKNILHFDLSPETTKRTCFSNVTTGSKINLEQSLKMGDELGGHFVTGHVDALIIVTNISKNSENWIVEFKVPAEYKKYIAEKGSVTINGVSLTVNYVENDLFKINIIPHTLQNTNLSEIKIGDYLNFEVDIIARYINRNLEIKQ
jgi:riboflavin synthase